MFGAVKGVTAVTVMALLMSTFEQFCSGSSGWTTDLSSPFSSGSTPVTTSNPAQNLNSNCRERKPLTYATKNTMLTEADLSRSVELCMGGNDQVVLYLRSLLNGLAAKSVTVNKTTKPARRFGFRRRDHAANMTSRVPTLHYMTMSVGQRSVCVGPDITLVSLKIYELVRSPRGISVHLMTGKNEELGTTTCERLVLTSARGQLVTVFLGTSQMWKISGDAEYSSRVFNDTHMSVTLGDVKVFLARDVARWSVLNTIDIRLNDSSSYGGLLGDILSSRTDDQVEEGGQDVEVQDQSCGSLAEHAGVIGRHIHSPMKFTHFFLDLLLDIAKNLPLGVFEATSNQGNND